MQFYTGYCPKCRRNKTLVFSNNPLSGSTICYDCVNQNLNYNNLEHAEFFCRTYNLPWNPDLWILFAKEQGTNVFQYYTKQVLDNAENQPNLAYTSSTKDLWSRTNKEWEKMRTFNQVMERIQPIKESYIERGALKWGDQYTFNELIRLDSLYTRTLRANNITDPQQKEAIKTLCKIQIEVNEAIKAKDAKAIKDFSSSYATYAKQANLDNMIANSKTEDITTVAELFDYCEKQGFKPKFYDGFPKDEVDVAIKDIQEANRRVVLESTGLQPLLEDMIRKAAAAKESQSTQDAINERNLQEMLNFHPDNMEVETESDQDIENQEFEEEDSNITKVVIN